MLSAHLQCTMNCLNACRNNIRTKRDFRMFGLVLVTEVSTFLILNVKIPLQRNRRHFFGGATESFTRHQMLHIINANDVAYKFSHFAYLS